MFTAISNPIAPIKNEEKRKSRLAGPSSKKIKFNKIEDTKLAQLIMEMGEGDWKAIALMMAPRTARQCRERWTNYINPCLSQEPWTNEEDSLLLQKHEEFGNRWKLIEKFFPARSKNNIKHRFQQIRSSSPDAVTVSSTMTTSQKHNASQSNSNSKLLKSTNNITTMLAVKNSAENMQMLDFDVIIPIYMPERDPLHLLFDRILDQDEMCTLPLIDNTDLWAIPDENRF